jgi:hypothetical protein
VIGVPGPMRELATMCIRLSAKTHQAGVVHGPPGSYREHQNSTGARVWPSGPAEFLLTLADRATEFQEN